MKHIKNDKVKKQDLNVEDIGPERLGETMYGRRIAGGRRWNGRKRDRAWKCERDPRREQRAWQERGCRGAGLRPDWPYLDAPAAFGALSSPTPRTLTLTLSLRGWMEGGPAHFSRPTWLHVLIGCRPLALTSLPLAASDTDRVDGRVPSTWLLFPEKKSRRDARRSGWNVNRLSIDRRSSSTSQLITDFHKAILWWCRKNTLFLWKNEEKYI